MDDLLLSKFQPRKVLPLMLFLHLVLHFPFMDMPPVSVHTWRQCNTLAVARNFYQEDMNILKPRIDRRGAGDGVTGMQFPSYEYAVALGYQVFGEQHWVERGLSWILTSLGALGMFGICLLLFKDQLLALICSWCYLWTPELFYHSINALPDILALSSSICAFYFFLRWRESGMAWSIVLSGALMALAGCTKAQYLVIGAPMAAISTMDLLADRLDMRRISTLVFYAIISLGLTAWWYIYANALIKSSGLNDFAIHAGQSFPGSWSEAGQILKNLLVSDVPETFLGYSVFVLFIIGIFATLKSKKSEWVGPFLFWSFLLLVYFILELGQFEFHLYYLLPFLPLCAILAAIGVRKLWQRRLKWLAIALLLAAPIHTALRIIPARWANDRAFPQREFSDPKDLERLQNAVPDNAYVVMGEDDSGCIFPYYLRKKGSTFSNIDDLRRKGRSGKPLLEEWMLDGARYLYTSENALLEDPSLRPYLKNTIVEVGSFTVVELKTNQK